MKKSIIVLNFTFVRKSWRYRTLAEDFPPRKRIDRNSSRQSLLFYQTAIDFTFSDRIRE